MALNFRKCKIIHLGFNNSRSVYNLDEMNLNETELPIRLITEQINISNVKQGKELNRTEFVDIRIQGNMIETYKIITSK